MNCSKCHMPLDSNARFCRNCGTPVSMPAQPEAPASHALHQFENAQTIPTIPWQSPPAQQVQQTQEPRNIPTQYMPPQSVPPQPGTFQQPLILQSSSLQQQGPPSQPGTFADNSPGSVAPAEKVAPKRRRGRGCFTGCLVMLIILVLVVTGGWFLLARPYLHNLASTQISNVLDNGISQIPVQASQAPPGIFPVQQNTLNNLIVLETAPSDPVQHMQVSITPANMTINFTVYGYSCTVSGIPASQNGHLVVTNVNIQGLASLIMSSDELTSLLNQKLAQAQAKLNHPILAVQLKNQELDLLFGLPGSV